jgi:hypothetical protein
MNKNDPQATARIIVPIVIATIVLWMAQAGPFQKKIDKTQPTDLKPYSDSWYPLGPGLIFKYKTRGMFRGESEESEYDYHRIVHREAGEKKWQAADSFKGTVVDNYFLAETKKGIELTSTGLNKNNYLLLPLNFGLNATWNVSKSLRATADGVPEDLEISIKINGEKKTLAIEAVRVRYDRFYDKKSTIKPDWYFEGYVWFSRGLGIVKEDSTNIEVPQANGSVSLKETWEIKELTAIDGKGF